MLRIFFIVIWFFTFAFTAGLALLACACALIFLGLESWGDFLMKELTMFVIVAAPIVGLILGLFGYLPGTKEKKVGVNSAKVEPHWTTKGIQYLILRIALFFLFALATFPVAGFAIWVVDHYDSHSDSILIIPILIYYFGLLWFSNKTAKYMAFDGQKLFGATKSALVDLRIRLAFLPLIGSLFAPKSKKQDEDL
jgi:hypothetical protein